MAFSLNGIRPIMIWKSKLTFSFLNPFRFPYYCMLLQSRDVLLIFILIHYKQLLIKFFVKFLTGIDNSLSTLFLMIWILKLFTLLLINFLLHFMADRINLLKNAIVAGLPDYNPLGTSKSIRRQPVSFFILCFFCVVFSGFYNTCTDIIIFNKDH